jgi:hypothetical protein
MGKMPHIIAIETITVEPVGFKSGSTDFARVDLQASGVWLASKHGSSPLAPLSNGFEPGTLPFVFGGLAILLIDGRIVRQKVERTSGVTNRPAGVC